MEIKVGQPKNPTRVEMPTSGMPYLLAQVPILISGANHCLMTKVNHEKVIMKNVRIDTIDAQGEATLKMLNR